MGCDEGGGSGGWQSVSASAGSVILMLTELVVALPQFCRRRHHWTGTTLIGEGTGKQQESVTSSYRLIFFTVKRACIPRATHCLYWAIASAGVNGRGLGLVTLAQVKAVCEGKQAEGQRCVNIPPLAVLAWGGQYARGCSVGANVAAGSGPAGSTGL